MKTHENALTKRLGTWMKILCALLCLFFVTTGMRAYAAVAIVEDNAGLLTGQEIQQLKAHAESVSSSRKCDVMLITTADTNGKSSGRYAEDYFLKNCTGDDGFVLIIDMDNREINVRTSGAVIPYMTDIREEQLLDDGFDEISKNRYAATLDVMLSDMESFFRAGVPSGQYSENVDTGEIVYYKEPKSLSMMEIVVSILAGLVAGAGIFAVVSGRYNMKTGGYRYDINKNMSLKLMDKSDQLENRFVTRRIVPKSPPPSSSGHSSGHTSVHTGSGGHTFGGGGGRKF